MTKKHLLALALALVLLTSLASPALAAETASVIRLTKTTGTVEISKITREVCLPAEKHAALQRLPCGDL